MKKTIFLCAVFTLTLFAACKKKSVAPATSTTTRVGNIYDDSSHLSTLYYYSVSEQIRGYYDDSGRYNYSFHYDGLQSITDVNISGSASYSIYYVWDSLGLADSSTVLSAAGVPGIKKKYVYDSNKFLTAVQWYNAGNTLIMNESFTIANGNIIQHSYNLLDSTESSLPTGTYTYTYYTGQTNTLSNLYFGQVYLGQSSSNPVKSCTYINGSTTSTTDYTYTYNGGLIVSELVYADSAGVSTTRLDSIHYNYYIQ